MTTTQTTFEGEVILDEAALHGDELTDSRLLGSPWMVAMLRLALLAALLLIWQLVAGDPKKGFALVDKFWISQPSEIAGRLGGWISDGSLWFNLAITLEEMLIGFVFGAAAGIALGVLLARNRVLARVLDPFIMGVNSIPKIALAPLFILWFGIGLQPKIVLVATVVFFLLFLNTFAGVRDVDYELVDILRLMGGGSRVIFYRVILPSAMPWILTGLKVAVPYSLIGAIVGEIIASNRGLGYLLVHAQGQFDTAGVFAVLFVLMVMGLVLNELVNRVETRLLRWKTAGSTGR